MYPQYVRIGRILCVYAASQTYTSTVFEHLESFRKYSNHIWHYVDFQSFNLGLVGLEEFDAVVLHYSVRLPYDQVSHFGIAALQAYQGLKVLFIQDEYDATNKAKRIIFQTQMHLVFSVVPDHSLEEIYPANEFPVTRFVSNFTGYVPDELVALMSKSSETAKRSLTIAYRGRPLPLRYGKLGQEKVEIGRRVREYCLSQGITCDIAWDESARIYGDDWYRFIGSAKAMLGSESGSNVFDWDGQLGMEIDQYRKSHPSCTDAEVYEEVVAKREVDGLMNQLSPRIFEMAAAKTVMVLMEGAYSGVLTPNVHYVPLKRDFSNMEQVFAMLADDEAVNSMAERTYTDVIRSGRYGYPQFVAMVDCELNTMFKKFDIPQRSDVSLQLSAKAGVTAAPFKAKPPLPSFITENPTILKRLVGRILLEIWQRVPMCVRPHIKRMLGRA